MFLKLFILVIGRGVGVLFGGNMFFFFFFFALYGVHFAYMHPLKSCNNDMQKSVNL